MQFEPHGPEGRHTRLAPFHHRQRPSAWWQSIDARRQSCQVETGTDIGDFVIAHASPDIADRHMQAWQPVLVVDDLGMSGQEDVECIFTPGRVPDQFTSTHFGRIPATGKAAEEIGEEEAPSVLQQLGVVAPLE